MSEKTVNPYFELKKADFLNAAAKKMEMKQDFNPERISEYAMINAEYASSAAELIKLGIESFWDEEVIIIVVNGENYEIPSKDICNILGEKQFEYLYENKKKSAEPVPNEDDYYYDKVDAESYTEPSWDYRNMNNSNMMMNPMMMNPFFAMMNYLMYPFQMQYPYNPNQGYAPQTPVKAKTPESKSSDDELSDILRNITDIQKKVINLEKAKVGTKEQVSSLETRYEAVKKDLKKAEDKNIAERERHIAEMQDLQQIMSEMDEKYEFLEKEKLALEENNKNLQSDFQMMKEEKERADVYVDELKAENGTFASRLEEASKNAAANERAVAEKRIRELQDERNKTSSELDKVRKELEAKKASDEIHIERYKNVKEERDNLKREVQKLRQEMEKMANNNTSLSSEAVALKEDNQKLKQDTQKFQELAFVDKKTGLLNINAFNRDFSKIDKNLIIAAQIHICGMKEINDVHGRQYGDAIIQEVGKTTKEFFPTAKVYRIYGDQFFVIVENGNMNSVKGDLFDMKNKLLRDAINIAYGAAAGYESHNHSEIIEKINKEVREMKHNSFKPQEVIVSMVSAEEEEAPVEDTALMEESIEEAVFHYMNEQ